MMRSLYSGVSGLKTHQTKMDVIGNNIANVNTVGFKSSKVLFRDVLYQTTSSATGATATTGGTNASQIGLGSKISSIATTISENGSAQSTNNPYDLMLTGDSFFVVGRAGNNYFTKVGAFQVDEAGCLVTTDGYQVMGWQVNPEDPTAIKKDTVTPIYIESEKNKVSSPEQTSKSFLAGNIDLTDKDLTSIDGYPMSMTIYDNLGYNYTIKFRLTQDPSMTDKSLYNLTIDSIKNAENVEILGGDDPTTPTVTEGGYTATMGGATSVQVKFNADTGAFEYVGAVGGKESLLRITPNSAANGNVFESVINAEPVNGITVDFSNMTMYSSNGKSTVKMIRGGTDAIGGGRAIGELTDVSIDSSGLIYGVYDNGETKLLGQLVVAKFTNPMGLEAVGSSLYKATQSSGQFDGMGTSVIETGGKMTQGVLEMSNVDLSTEFTEMITTQRGYQANSRIITTSDAMLEELVNLKR